MGAGDKGLLYYEATILTEKLVCPIWHPALRCDLEQRNPSSVGSKIYVNRKVLISIATATVAINHMIDIRLLTGIFCCICESAGVVCGSMRWSCIHSPSPLP